MSPKGVYRRDADQLRERLKRGRQTHQENLRSRLATLPITHIGRTAVYTDAEKGIQFTIYRTLKGPTRRYGRIAECQTCGKSFFSRQLRSGRYVLGCSVKCGTKNAADKRGGPKMSVLDHLFSKLIRASGVCVKCGATSGLQCAHILSRRYANTRFDPQNAVPLCARCHVFFTHRPLEWEEWVVGRIGGDAYRELRKKALSDAKIDRLAIAADIRRWAVERGIPDLWAIKNGVAGFPKASAAGTRRTGETSSALNGIGCGSGSAGRATSP